MRKLLDNYRKRQADKRFKEAKEALRTLVKNRDPEIYKEVATIAQGMANNMVIHWLDGRRISHCRLCPNTAPLIKASDGNYLCQIHAKMQAGTPVLNGA